jgi:hypothetical protein
MRSISAVILSMVIAGASARPPRMLKRRCPLRLSRCAYITMNPKEEAACILCSRLELKDGMIG